jgi:hypothetical protein
MNTGDWRGVVETAVSITRCINCNLRLIAKMVR